MIGRLGIVTAGSLEEGVEVRLDTQISVEDMAVGRYVTIEGKKRRFFGMINDVTLEVTDQRLTLTPPDIADPFIAEVLSGTSTYGTVHVVPMLTMGSDAESQAQGPMPVKTIPSHFSTVNLASDTDIEVIFGKENESRFWIGNPLDMETKICLDLPKLVTRSNGVFGKSGTGKTFLTRILLIGMLQKSAAVNLIFDMHSEYGWAGTSEGSKSVKALKQLFPAQVSVFTLDEENSRRRRVSTDFVVRIGYTEIEPEDLVLLRQTLNLTDLAVEAAYQLRRKFGQKSWVLQTIGLNDAEATGQLLEELKIHESTFQNLQRGLNAVTRLPFVVEQSPDNAVKSILDYLERGINVVLEFGRFADLTAYILVSNLLTRRIYAKYRERMEKAIGEESAKPTPLVITIEEAHKFLNPEVASQTIFGTIAREMRKYNVTLLVIDQRPSGIDPEVMSQLGTKITCLLDNERDVDSVLAGVSGKNALKAILSRLESRQQALIFGHAVPMPVVIKTREYGSEQSYKSFMPSRPNETNKPTDIEDLWK